MGGLDFTIYTKEDLKEAVQALGFLPLFANEILDFSIEEHTVPKAWCSEEPGVGEWKGPVIRESGCAYGKFFGKKPLLSAHSGFRTLQISVGMGMISMHCMMMGLPITGIRNYMSFWKGNPLSCQES